MMPADLTPEFDFIRSLRNPALPDDPRVFLGIGDDTAIIRTGPSRQLLVTTDMLMEGSCFLLQEAGPERVGRKAMNANLSDIAAMAGIPTAAVVSLGLPRHGGRAIADGLYRGLRAAADQYRVSIVGGDTNSWDGPLTISVTLFGEPTARGTVRRNGARIGDAIIVTGPLGGSILGRHLDFRPRVLEALHLHIHADIHAMIDISDGLAADLWHICEESGVGAKLRADAIPIHDDAQRLAARTGRSPSDHAISDGEDFELIVVMDAKSATELVARRPIPGVELSLIGEIIENGLWLDDQPLTPKGYVHHFS